MNYRMFENNYVKFLKCEYELKTLCQGIYFVKVLIISHNVFSNSSSMGKTLSCYFNSWVTEDIAQFFIHSEVPTAHICENYYRVTDKEALYSIITRHAGQVIGANKIEEYRSDSRTDTGLAAGMYQRARKRTPAIYLARNTIWLLSAWKNRKFEKWLNDFSPDAVFLASGDYAFLYRLGLKIAKQRKIPLLVSCMDDYYFYNKNSKSFVGRNVHTSFMRQVKRTMNYASAIFTICEKMTVDYQQLFGKPCYTLHTSASFDAPLKVVKKQKISYLGNLGYQRYMQLVVLGRSLKVLNIADAPKVINVYSSESRAEIVKWLVPENGIQFHGQVNAAQVKQIIGESMAVVHTESFDEEIRKSVKYSISTKIPDSLASGTCLLVYGAEDIASVEYVKKNGAAFVITDKDDLKTELTRFLTDSELRNAIQERAVALAKQNHNMKANSELVEKVFANVVSKART